VNSFDERDDVLDGCFGQNAVPEVEDVAGASFGSLKNAPDVLANYLRRGEQ
jgi:hypothetical protein